jgi:hypothetical protein
MLFTIRRRSQVCVFFTAILSFHGPLFIFHALCMCRVEWLVETSSKSSTILSLKLFLAKKATAIEVAVQWQVNRTRGARVLYRNYFRVAIHLACFSS